jgi:hypothetical protein
MNKRYRFIVIFERDLTHEEVNDLECALSAQCEDYGPFISQLVKAEDTIKDDDDSPPST